MPVSSSAASQSAYETPVEEPEAPRPAEAVAFTANQAHRTGPENYPGTAPPVSTELAQTWLAWQCRMIAGIIRGAIYPLVGSDSIGAAITTWPAEGDGASQMIAAANLALRESSGVVNARHGYGPDNHRTCDLVATALLVDDEPVAVIVVMMSTRSESQQQSVLQLLQWGGLWMETLINRQSAARREADAFSLGLLSTLLSHTSAHIAAMETVNQLADQLGCERVSIGFRQGLAIRLQALSHVAGFDPRTQLVRRIEAAMEEAVDQSALMVQPCPPNRESLVNRAHAELVEQQGTGAVCTIPLPGRSGTIGAITLERDASQPFDRETLDWCDTLARLIGPTFELRQREERSFWSKGIEALLGLATGVFGPTRLKLKLALLSVITLVALLSMIDGNYRVTAPASIEGAVRQVVVAPYDGFVKQAEVRAGDLVDEGQLLASLDDRTLQLEQQKWQSERNKIEKEYQQALAKRSRAELSVLHAQIDQVDAELRLVKDRIARSRLHAPFQGVVVSGDLSQSQGAPVEMGQILYEVAPLDSYRVVLEVDEHDVADLDAGRSGQLIIAALPQTPFAISLEQLVPVAVSDKGVSFFRVEAALNEPSPLLRPGMRGVAKIEMGQRSLLWNWTHALVDRIRLWAWSGGL